MIWLLVALLIPSTSMIVVTWNIAKRNKFFRKHMVASRQYQLDSMQAFQDGDRARAELLLAAAQEELDRAEHYA